MAVWRSSCLLVRGENLDREVVLATFVSVNIQDIRSEKRTTDNRTQKLILLSTIRLPQKVIFGFWINTAALQNLKWLLHLLAVTHSLKQYRSSFLAAISPQICTNRQGPQRMNPHNFSSRKTNFLPFSNIVSQPSQKNIKLLHSWHSWSTDDLSHSVVLSENVTSYCTHHILSLEWM